MVDCSVGSCTSVAYARAYCMRHYTRWRRGQRITDLTWSELVWSHIAVGDFDQCWEWTGSRNDKGYGRIKTGGRSYVAHRVAFEQFWRRPLEGIGCHSCNNPPCCNPFHVYDGTHRTNARDRVAAGTDWWSRPESPRARGERVAQSKLTEDAVREIRRRYTAGGVSQQSLADEFGVNQTKISDVVRRRTWRHVE
ncbi:HNH endonuclease [Gordonia phage SCentae]|nr:HNH endonuclease [Gordonia phage SCentae]